MEKFNPYNTGGKGLPYHEVPEEVAGDRDTLASWADAAFRTALRNRKKK
jgi:hypothetical protein